MSQLFESETHKRVLYFANLQGVPLLTSASILDTGVYQFNYSYGIADRFSCSLSQDSAGHVGVAWAVQREFLDDILYPREFSKPVLRCATRNNGSFEKILEIESSDHPCALYDPHGVLHLLYESVTFCPYSPPYQSWYDTTYFFVTSVLHYRLIHPNGRIDSVLSLPGGFRPQLHIDRTGDLHMFWLKADSSNSPYFQLMYNRNPGPSGEGTVIVHDAVCADGEYGINRCPPVFVSFVDDSGRASVGWTNSEVYNDGRIYFARRLPDARWSIDSLTGLPLWHTQASFLVASSGDAHVLWQTNNYDSGWTLHHSYSSPHSQLFLQQRAFQSPYLYAGAPMIVADSRGVANTVFDDGPAGIGYLRNLDAGPDTMLHFSPGSTIAYGIRGLPGTTTRRASVLLDGIDQLWIVRNNDGLALLKIDPSITGVDDKDAMAIEKPVLAQNYPNPFNPSTTICYGLPTRSHVTLTVFNTLGQQVALLQDGEQDAGYHEIKFDGSGLSSGVYFDRMQAGTYAETKKLLIVR